MPQEQSARNRRAPLRAHPTHGVRLDVPHPVVVFLTVSTKDRRPWLATPAHHALLRTVWREATAWRVGRYVILPDHLHLFAAPGDPPVDLDNWVRYWKSQFSKRRHDRNCRWQADHWDTRLRGHESYQAKWEYVVENPVRHELVRRADEWPFQGELFNLEW